MSARVYLIAIVIVMILAAFVVASALAEPEIPDGVQFFTYRGELFVIYPDGSGEHICPCREICNDDPALPTSTAIPSDTPVPSPSDTPMPTLPPTERVKCNRGLGNGSEGCDPGNSPGKPGAAGEDNE